MKTPRAKRLKSLVLLGFVCLTSYVWAGITRTYYSQQSGDASHAIWATTPTGTAINLPPGGQEQHIVIQAGHSVNLDLNLLLTDVTIESTAVLSVNAREELDLKGDWFNDGTFNPATGVVSFSAEVSQTISGSAPTTFYECIADNKLTLTIATSEVIIEDFIHLLRGKINTNGLLRLQSNSSGTGMFGRHFGQILGAVTVERYHDAQAQDWIMIASPVNQCSIADINDDVITTGFTGADYPSYGFNNILYYDETMPGADNDGFVGATDLSNALAKGEGVMVYVTEGELTIDITGGLNRGAINLPLSYTDFGSATDDGWCLVGNPFACSIDWDSALGWTKKNINEAVHIYDAAQGVYATYVNGIGNNGGTNLIAPGQAFWVQTNGSSPSLQVGQDAKTFVQSSFKNNEDEGIARIAIQSSTGQDQVTLALKEDASLDYDQSYDAAKLFTTNEKHSIYSKSTEGNKLSISSFGLDLWVQEIPVFVSGDSNEEIILSWEGLATFSNGSCIVLRDNYLGEDIDWNNQIEYTFNHDSEWDGARFTLYVSPSAEKEITPPTCHNDASGSIELQGAGQGPWTFQVWDGAGNQIWNAESNEPQVMSDLGSGYYTYSISNFGECGSMDREIFLHNPEAVEITSVISQPTCNNSLDGSINIEAFGGVGPYSIIWSDNTVGNAQEGISAGNYRVDIEDSKGCAISSTLKVEAENDLQAEFTVSTEFHPLVNGLAVVEFENMTEGAEEFEWSFGDNTLNSFEINPTHGYTTAGVMTVVLKASNETCESTYERQIEIVGQATLINDAQLEENVNAYLDQTGIHVNLSFDEPREILIRCYNALGQLINQPMQTEITSTQLFVPAQVRTALIEVYDVNSSQRVITRVAY